MPAFFRALLPSEQRIQLAVKLCGFTLGVLCMGSLMLALFLQLRFDGPRLAAELAEHSERNWQRSLVLESTPQLSLWPRLRLQLGAATLSEPGRGETFASWREAHLEPALLPLLLHGRLELRRVEIDGLLLRLMRDRKGVWNGEDLLDATSDRPVQLQLDALVLRQADVTLDDLPTSRQAQWRKLELRADALRAGQGGRLQLDSQVIAGQPSRSALEGRLTLAANYRFDEGLEGGALTQGRASFSGRTDWVREARLEAGFDAFEWQADGWQVRQVRLQGNTGATESDLRLNANLPAARWRDGLNAALLEVAVQRGEQGALRLEFAQLQSIAGDNDRVKGSLSAELRQIAKTDKAGKDEALQIGAQGRAAVTFNLREGSLTVADFNGRLDAKHPALHPAFGTQLLRGEVRLASDADAPLLDLRGEMSGSAGALQFETSLTRGRVNSLRSKLSGERFDLDSMVMPARWRDWLPAADQLKGWSLDGELRLGKLKLAGLQLESVVVPVQQADGKVELGEFSATLYGGRHAGRWRWDAAAQRYDTSQTLRGVALDALKRDSGLQLPLGGLTNATLEASGRTGTWPEPCRSAEGVLRIYSRDTRWLGADMPRSMLDLSPGQQRAARNETTPLDEISAALRFEQGSLQVERLSARSTQLSLTGSGRVACSGASELSLLARAGSDKSMSSLKGQLMNLRVTADAAQATVQRATATTTAAAR
ncbi:AsmA family protein [Viridibacterium curvum]|uniref:AsmA family protein n=1 Tax=Viridibacterium curvum TaxID=1101404 RepID=A0ABP9QQ40_9RHOO